MEDPLTTSLIVTGIGMLILFVAMALLYGLIVGMTTLIKDGGEEDVAHPQGTVEPTGAEGARNTVAAIAVALARAELERQSHALRPPGPAESPWRQVHHQRLLNHPQDRGKSR
jgi:Na+-transporting methylmalonyl-CoA/oxaloacetate decarboxylase gamma subunit